MKMSAKITKKTGMALLAACGVCKAYRAINGFNHDRTREKMHESFEAGQRRGYYKGYNQGLKDSSTTVTFDWDKFVEL